MYDLTILGNRGIVLIAEDMARTAISFADREIFREWIANAPQKHIRLNAMIRYEPKGLK